MRWDSISEQRGKRMEARHHGQADAVGRNAGETLEFWRLHVDLCRNQGDAMDSCCCCWRSLTRQSPALLGRHHVTTFLSLNAPGNAGRELRLAPADFSWRSAAVDGGPWPRNRAVRRYHDQGNLSSWEAGKIDRWMPNSERDMAMGIAGYYGQKCSAVEAGSFYEYTRGTRPGRACRRPTIRPIRTRLPLTIETCFTITRLRP